MWTGKMTTQQHQPVITHLADRSQEELELAEQLLNHSQAGRVGPSLSDGTPATINSPTPAPAHAEGQVNDQDEEIAIPRGSDPISGTDGSASDQAVIGQTCRYGLVDLINRCSTVLSSLPQQLWNNKDAPLATIYEWLDHLQCLRPVSESAKYLPSHQLQATFILSPGWVFGSVA